MTDFFDPDSINQDAFNKAEKLSLGCGREVREGWTNLDHPTLAAQDDRIIGCDIDQPDVKLPFDDDTFDMVEAMHVLEHIHHLLPLVQEVHRVLKPGGGFYVAVPFGSSDDAFEDPTHVRRFFPGSWCYFSQPTYWRSDYGYRGDFKPDATILYVDQLRYPAGEAQTSQVIEDIVERRNVVQEMRVAMHAVKPIRSWDDPGGMDKWETRVVFVDTSEVPNADSARQARAEEANPLWTPGTSK